MAVVYIAEQGASISKKGDRLYIFLGNQLLRWIFTKDIDQLILMGNINLTPQTITYLLKNKIDTVFLSYYGKYKGRLMGEFGKNISLRLAQYHHLLNPDKVLKLAYLYISTKLDNSLYLLERKNYHFRNKDVAKNIVKIAFILNNNLKKAHNLNKLRGFEGIAAKYYFNALSHLFKNKDFEFSSRNRRPPKDKVNALLSLGYTLLLNQILAKTYIAGLDPFLGALHDLYYGRQSLVLDIMEEFRPLIDNLVINSINKRIIRKEHFIINFEDYDEELDYDANILPVRLNSDGMKKFIYQFNQLLESRFYSDYDNDTFALKDIFLLQCRKLVRLFKEEDKYTGFKWRIAKI